MFSIEIHTANLQTDDILDRPTTDRTQMETIAFIAMKFYFIAMNAMKQKTFFSSSTTGYI